MSIQHTEAFFFSHGLRVGFTILNGHKTEKKKEMVLALYIQAILNVYNWP
jgi:hypothetical protein